MASLSPPNAADSTNSPRHVYRLALYGRKNSGKSCILAALALGLERLPHPEGLNCVWVYDETNVPVPNGSRDSWNLSDPVTTRHLGREWLKGAKERLKAGDVPPPTPINVAPYRFLFDFNDPRNGQSFRVEMVDYSGELVRGEGSEETFAKMLREHLESMDGILVLAEAPRPGEEMRPMYRELSLLLEAFTLLADQRRGKQIPPFPVAMVFNKWDRQSRMDRFTPGEASVEVDVYLRRDPPPPQVGLLNTLSTVSGSTPQEPNCRPFAMSAFGKAVAVTRTTESGEQATIDLPASPIPLPAYGLEDPFLWLCKRSDELEGRRLRDAVSRLKPWNLAQLVRGKALTDVRALERYAERFPENSPRRQEVEAMVHQTQTTFFKQVGITAAAAAGLFFATINGLFYMYDRSSYHAAERAIASSDAPDTLTRWKSAESYLASYVQSNWYRTGSHLFFRWPSATQPILQGLRERLATATKCETEIAGLEQRRDAATVEPALLAVEKAATALTIPDDLVFLAVRHKELNTSLNRKKEEILAKTEEGRRRNAFRKFLDNARFADAASYILGGEVSGLAGLRERLSDEFRTQAPAALKARVREQCQRGDWPAAEASINAFRNSDAVREVLQSQPLLARLNGLAEWVQLHRRETLYGRWYSLHDDSTTRQILEGDDEKYKPYVRAYREYRERLTASQNWKIKVSEIELDNLGGLDKTWGKPSLRVELYGADGSLVSAFDREFSVSSPGRTSWSGTDLLTTPQIRASDEFTVRIRMKAQWSVNGEWNVGEAREATSILGLSRAIQLRDDSSQRYWSYYFPGASPPRIFLAVDSPAIPTMPSLPSPQDPTPIDAVSFP